MRSQPGTKCLERNFEGETEKRIGCARAYRTLRDGSFEDAFPGTSCQATIGVSLRDGLADASQRATSRESASRPFVGAKTSQTAPKLDDIQPRVFKPGRRPERRDPGGHQSERPNNSSSAFANAVGTRRRRTSQTRTLILHYGGCEFTPKFIRCLPPFQGGSCEGAGSQG